MTEGGCNTVIGPSAELVAVMESDTALFEAIVGSAEPRRCQLHPPAAACMMP